MSENKKGFRAGLYAVTVGIVLAVVLAAMAFYQFVTTYTAYSPEKVAQSFVDTVVQKGDGYNAYKNTLLSQNKKLKYGDFLRRAYLIVYVNEKDENGNEIPQASFVGTGSSEEQAAIDKVYNTMYDYLVELIDTVGFDNYDELLTKYFDKLVEVRREVYGDDFMNYDYMFGAFEANVAAYGDYLTGTERKIASDNKTVLQQATEGKYQELFGKEQQVEAEDIVDGKKQTVTETKKVYHFTTEVVKNEPLNEADLKQYIEGFKQRIAPVAASGEAKAEKFSLSGEDKENMINAFKGLDCSDSITAVNKLTVSVKLDDGTEVATQELYAVSLGNVWYVDNTNIDTSALYLAK
ncbi:MAG: hypothetical protein IJL63_02710 [Clostridia bacterium]|nr:hypothetical protein [Clostridia bacterium]